MGRTRSVGGVLVAFSTRNPGVRGSTGVTTLPVTVIVGSLAGGMAFEEVQSEYDLTADGIRAALKFLVDLAEQESFHPLSAI